MPPLWRWWRILDTSLPPGRRRVAVDDDQLLGRSIQNTVSFARPRDAYQLTVALTCLLGSIDPGLYGMTVGLRIVDRMYQLHEQLGAGGMGDVYRATHRLSGRNVAIKLVAQKKAAVATRITHSADLRLFLAREFHTLSSLHHPHVVQVLDYGFDEQAGPYFTMELLPAPKTIIDVAGGLSIAAKVRLLAQVLRALAYLHRRGILHRDLKPSNVLCVGETVKVVDFGLAVATDFVPTNHVAGTVQYMAPELLSGRAPTISSDLYALGVIAEELLTERPPSIAAQIAQESTVVAHGAGWVHGQRDTRPGLAEPAAAAAPLAEVPEELARIVRRLRAIVPSDRYGSAVEVMNDLGTAIGEPLPIETSATRESFLVASEFIGREQEVGELRRALDDACQGRGSSWLVGGESGVGKSRLASELRTLALVAGISVVQGQAVSEGGQSYEVWIPVLRALAARADIPDEDATVLKELVPDLPEILGRPIPDLAFLPMAAAQGRLLAAIEALVRRQRQPTLVLLEDLQWAGPDSVSLLGHLSTFVAELSLVIIGTFRDEEAPELPRVLPAMRPCRLSRLSRDDVARLSVSMLGRAGDDDELVDFFWRETEGNVLFLIEIVRALAEQSGSLDHIRKSELPAHVLTGGIERLVLRRIERVPEAAHALVEVAAARGRKLDLLVLEKAAPGQDLAQWLVNCANAAVLERQGGDWYFAHDKLREAVLARLDPDRRTALHRLIGDAIEAVYPDAARDPQAAALAHHFQQAGDGGKAWTYHMRAGNLATRSCSYGQARQHYATALELLDQLADHNENRRRKIDTLLQQVFTTMVADSAEQNLGRMTEALALLERIADTGQFDREDELRRARVNNVIGRVYFYSGQPGAAVGYFEKVLPIAQERGDDELLAMSSLLIGTAMLVRGDAARAEPLLAQSIGPIERTGEPFEWFRAVGYHGLSLVLLGRYRDGMRELARIMERAREIRQANLLSASHIMAGTTHLLAGDWHMAQSLLRAALDYATRTGDKLHLNLAWSSLGWAASALGLHGEAQAARAAAEQIASTMGGRLMLDDWYRAADAEIAFNAGQLERALELARATAEASAAAGLLLSQGVAQRVLGDVLALQGRDAEADRHMELSIAAFEKGSVHIQAARTRVHWALQLRRRGALAEAERLYAQARAQMEGFRCKQALREAERQWANP